MRTAAWTEREGRVVVERPLPPVRGLASLLRRISALTGVRRLRLDERGSLAWRRFDGATSVGEVARTLHAELRGADRADAEVRLVRFVRMLRNESLVALPGLDDARIAQWRARSEGGGGGPAGNPGA